MKPIPFLCYIIAFIPLHVLCDYSCGLLSDIGEIFPPEPQHLEVHSDIVFNCSLNRGFGYNSSDIIFKLDNDLLAQSQVQIVDEYRAQLRIANATQDDSGLYYCYVKRENESLVCVSEAIVGYKPKDRPVKDFSCVYKLKQYMNCSWTKPQNKIETDYALSEVQHKYHYCTIKEIDNKIMCDWNKMYARSKYEFKLDATNTFGKHKQKLRFNLSSIVQLDAPQNLSFDKQSNTLSWTYPPHIREYDSLYHLLQFKISAINLGQKDDSTIVLLNYTHQSFVLDLKPFTEYNLSISCKVNDPLNENWSPFSSIIARTKVDVPAVAPTIISQAFETQSASPRSATLYWKALEDELKNSLDAWYVVTYVDGYSNREDSITTNSTEYTFNGLSYASIEFRVYSANSAGLSKNYSTLILPATESRLLLPNKISVYVTNEGNSYIIKWHKSNVALLQNYTVFWCKATNNVCTSSIEWRFVTGTNCTIDLPRANYKFGVSSNTRESSSGIGWAECFINTDRKIEKLNHLSAKRQGPTSILVQWGFLCDAQKEFVQHLDITYCPIDDCRSETEMTQSIRNLTQDHYSLDNLRPNQTYKIVVHSPYIQNSENISSQTDYGIPLTPFNLTTLSQNAHSIRISWNFSPEMTDHFKVDFSNATYTWPITSCQAQTCNWVYNETSLRAFTNYSIFVSSCNLNAICSEPTSTSFQTAPSAPGKMPPPIIENNGSKHLIYFNPPLDTNGPIAYYYLKQTGNKETLRYSAKEKFAEIDVKCKSAWHPEIYKVSLFASNIVNGRELKGEQSDWVSFEICKSNGLFYLLIAFIIVAVAIFLSVTLIFGFRYINNLKAKKKGLQIKVECNNPNERDQLALLTREEDDLFQAALNAPRNGSSSLTNPSINSDSSRTGNSVQNCSSSENGFTSGSSTNGDDFDNYRENREYFITNQSDDSSKPLLSTQATAEPAVNVNSAIVSSPLDRREAIDLNKSSFSYVLANSLHSAPKPSTSSYVSPILLNTMRSHYVPHTLVSSQATPNSTDL